MEEATINMEVGVKAEVEAGVVTYINSETGEQVLMTGENGEQVLMTGEHGEQILMTGENGEQILMTGENGQQVLMTGENGEQVLMTTGEVLESFSEGGEESVLGYQEAEDTGQPGQDLVSLAMETSKVTGLAAAEETKEEGPPQDQEAADTEDYPDEIECQLVQKSVFLDGEVKTIDFIMCNQCPRLFRSENLLWNHIKAKHKRRTYRRLPLTSHALDRNYSSVAGGGSPQEGELEPGEIDSPAAAPRRTNPLPLRRSDVVKSDVKKEALFVVGLEKSGNKLGRPPGAVTSPEKFLRQKARKRIYVDSNHGPFKCPGCDNVTFSNRRSLDMHMKRLHKAGIVECDECGRKVLDLKRHKEILHK